MKDGQFRISSRKHGNEVIAVLNSMHKFNGSTLFQIQKVNGWTLFFQGLTERQVEDLDSILSNL